MFLSRFKAFVFQKGIGLKIIIPLSFLVAILLSLQIVSPFQKSLETQEIQSLVTLIATPDSDIKNIQESLKIEKINATNYTQVIIAQALFTLREKGLIGTFTVAQLNQLMHNAFYLQAVFLSIIITLLSVFSFLFLYLLLTVIGPLFHNGLEKHVWGRILTPIWSVILIIYLIGTKYQLVFGLTYFYIIAILSALIMGVYLKKNV